MLEQFRAAQMPSIQRLLALEAGGAFPAPFPGPRPPFAARLRREGPGALIAEYKRASPSRGEINLSRSPEEVALLYARSGASALSVLTEEAHFKGDIRYLERMRGAGLPMLRKDFLVHPLQVAETAATPASALLLIVRMLDRPVLEAMLRASQKYGLEAVLEVFDEPDLDRAREALDATGATPAIIQVNNRDLQTLAVNDNASRTLIRRRAPEELWISASGVSRREQVEERAALGFDAVLVGTALMEGDDPGAALAGLRLRQPSAQEDATPNAAPESSHER